MLVSTSTTNLQYRNPTAAAATTTKQRLLEKCLILPIGQKKYKMSMVLPESKEVLLKIYSILESCQESRC